VPHVSSAAPAFVQGTEGVAEASQTFCTQVDWLCVS